MRPCCSRTGARRGPRPGADACRPSCRSFGARRRNGVVRAAASCAGAAAKSSGPSRSPRRARGRTRRRTGEITGGRRRRASDLQAPRSEREGRFGHDLGQAARHDERRPGRVERDIRRAEAGHLHLFDVGRRHEHQRPVESSVPDVVRQFPDDVRRPGADGVAAGRGGAARRNRTSCVSLDDRERRSRLLRLHAARLRRAAIAAVSCAAHPARAR